MPQTPLLIEGTVADNLDPFGCFTRTKLLEVLNKVGLGEQEGNGEERAKQAYKLRAEGILDMDANSGLSAGQKQLLSLARALLSNTKIVVFDEPTSNVDAMTDQKVQSVIRKHFADATVITIAHRLHTIIGCDRILVMEDGKVAEFDSPRELLGRPNSHFYEIASALGPKTMKSLTRRAQQQQQNSKE